MFKTKDLKTCPFCGTKSHLVLVIGRWPYVKCLKCGASSGKQSSRIEAIISWNTRRGRTVIKEEKE